MRGDGKSAKRVALKLEPSLKAVGRCSVCSTSQHFPMRVPQKRNYLGPLRRKRT